MTPAINSAKRARIRFVVHEYTHDSQAASYGLEAAEALGVAPGRVFKTLLVALQGCSGSLGVGVVPVASRLDLKAIAQALGAKKAEMADPREAERVTGYVVGGISPLGQKKRLATVMDESATGYETVYVSAGRRGLEIELAPRDLLSLCEGKLAAIAR
jgi:Cys-tRNA(Pro)/Cys-tRNA(Cys) deacylase